MGVEEAGKDCPGEGCARGGWTPRCYRVESVLRVSAQNNTLTDTGIQGVEERHVYIPVAVFLPSPQVGGGVVPFLVEGSFRRTKARPECVRRRLDCPGQWPAAWHRLWRLFVVVLEMGRSSWSRRWCRH